MKLTGEQLEQFSDALRGAFGVPQLQRMLRFRIGKDLEDYSSLQNDKQQIVFELITKAGQEGWALKLLQTAREANPGNAELQILGQAIGMVPAGLPEAAELERMVTAMSMLDITAWRERLGAIEVRTCMVEIGNKPAGTGFLLAPDLVMTNYHVVEHAIKGTVGVKPESIGLRFDFKRLADGTTINPGVVYRLVKGDGWLVDCSPYSALDTMAAPLASQFPATTELDYALLRVDGKPGTKPVGTLKMDKDAPARGWMSVPAAPYDFAPDSALYIVQHPLGQPLKLALDTNSIMNVNDVRTRVRYRTNTDPGSSGSPCFDHDWNLVALHHSGDPAKVTPTWNEGIPIDKILELLGKRGKAGELNQPLP
jgi:hypothetical protein